MGNAKSKKPQLPATLFTDVQPKRNLVHLNASPVGSGSQVQYSADAPCLLLQDILKEQQEHNQATSGKKHTQELEFYAQLVEQCLQPFSMFGEGFPKALGQKMMNPVNVKYEIEHHSAGVEIVQRQRNTHAIWVVLKGSVDVVALMHGRMVVIQSLNVGQYFGEMSLFFRMPASASIVTTCESSFLVVGEILVASLLHLPVAENLKEEWCVVNHYITAPEGVRPEPLQTRLALDYIKQVPVFQLWMRPALKILLSMVSGDKILIYEKEQVIQSTADVANKIHIVVNGTFTLVGRNDKRIDMMVLKEPFVYGLQGLFADDETVAPAFALAAKTSCQVISLEFKYIHDTVSEITDQVDEGWRKSSKRWKEFNHSRQSLCQDYPELMSYEGAYTLMHHSPMFHKCSVYALNRLILYSTPIEFSMGEVAYTVQDHASHHLVFCLQGELAVRTDMQELFTEEDLVIRPGNGFWAAPWMPEMVVLECTIKAVVLKFEKRRIEETSMMYAQCEIKALKQRTKKQTSVSNGNVGVDDMDDSDL